MDSSGQSSNNKPKRQLYDYSRTSGQSGHWYSGSTNNPLAGAPSRNARPQRPAESAPPRRSRVRSRIERRRQFNTQNWAWWIIAATMVGMTVITAMIFIFALGGDENSNTVSSQALLEPTSIVYAGEGEVRGALAGGNSLVIAPWDGEERFTVLLMGLDNRPDESDILCRTDTLMIISIDPVSDRIGILSIPRDTHVQILGYDDLRPINEACLLGNLELPGKGPRLAMQTIQYNFGIRVNAYVMINFNAFMQIIDRIGGIDIYVQQTIDDPLYPDMFYGYDHFYIEAGQHHMDGETALKYARSRHSTDDIDRGRRQQEVIFAVRDKILSVNMLDDLIGQAVPLWNDINAGIETDLELDQIVQLALYAREIPDQNIQSTVLGWDYLRPYREHEGEEPVLVPRRGEELSSLLTEVFGPNYNQ